jgi:Dockerin type I domain
MKPSRPTRRVRTPSLATERLEDRQMLTGGVGSTFAIIPATISKAGGQVAVSFALNPSLFTDKGNKPFVLGIDVAPNTNSTANPIIRSVTTPTGQTLSVTHANFDQKVKRTGVQGTSSLTTAALVNIPGLPAKTATSFTYKVNVQGLSKTSGSVLVGFYLPGDADGSGVVNQADINAIKYAMNTNAGQSNSKYSFDADSNRDGMVTMQDLSIAQKNLGIGTTVSPVISANVAPSMMVDPTNRITNLSHVTVTGAATPNSTITYSETGVSPIAATADKSGNYSINLPLLTGSNTYNVATTDAFDQKISGSINAITYNPTAVAPTAPASSSTTPTNGA